MTVAVSDDLIRLREETPEQRRGKRRRSRRVLIVALTLLALIVAAVLAAIWFLGSSLSPYDRIPNAFDLPEAGRPTSTDQGTTFLLAGTDRRSEELTTGEGAQGETWLPGAQRSDAIMVAHLSEDGERAYVVSIPRDSWVDIPGYGMNKVNAAFSFGGPSLYVQTIEQLTNTRVDRVAVVDWTGLIGLVDVLGGVELTFDEETVARNRTWPPGTHLLNGEEVRDYVGERYRLPRGDFDRVERQQNVLRALGVDMIEEGVARNPAKALEVARATTQFVSLDSSFSVPQMVRLALSARGLRPDNVTFMTVPTTGTGFEGDQSVVYLNEPAQKSFWKAFRTDRLEQWIDKNGARTTPEDVA
jgi:LCP family protein required for cell wall assembly